MTKPPGAPDPRQIDAAFRKAVGLHQAGRLAEAAKLYDAIIAAIPGHMDALHLRGVVALQSGEGKLGLRLIAKAIQLEPRNPGALNNLGKGHRDLGQPREGLAACDKAIALQPDYAEAQYNRAGCLQDLGRLKEAVAGYDRALALAPGMAAAWSDRANVLLALGQPEAALASAEAALARHPDLPEALANRGSALRELNRPEDALACFDRAVALRPGAPQFQLNRGNALRDLGRLEDAVAAYDAALALAPGLAAGHANRAAAWLELQHLDRAIADLDRAVALEPDAEFLLGTALFTRMQACAWDGVDARLRQMVAGIRQGKRLARPFAAVALSSSRSVQSQAARSWAALAGAPEGAAAGSGGERIRLGYFSSDLREHAIGHLTAELIERHDRSRFEVIAYAFGPASEGPQRQRLRRAFDRFVDVTALSDEAACRQARADGIDIAIDLNGYTRHARSGILARRAAPVQVNWLGFPGTMGAGFMDYLLADPVVIPEDHRADYAERIAWLPHSYQPSDTTRALAPGCDGRAANGLPEQGVAFCCFNNSWKITPEVLDAWARILGRVPGSVLWLLEDTPLATGNLRREAAARGLDPARLVFAPRRPPAEHLARHRAADLFLDTLPYNAHTTASDALWAGLPVLTQPGATFAGRVAASLLTAAGLPELIAPDRAAYEGLAVGLATEPGRIAALRQKVTESRGAAPLFDMASFTRHIEQAYAAMQARRLAGLPPDHLRIPA